jgi:hypothetical protein
LIYYSCYIVWGQNVSKMVRFEECRVWNVCCFVTSTLLRVHRLDFWWCIWMAKLAKEYAL